MQTVAVGWQLYALTGSALDLGLVGLVQFVPTVVLTLVVGQVADRYDRRLVVGLCHVAEAGAAAALALGTLGGWLNRDGILTIVAVLGAARAFENPARAALVPRLVPVVHLPRAIASVTSAGQAARIVGPALGGALYGFGATTVYVIVAVLYLAAGALLAFVRDAQPVRARGDHDGLTVLGRRLHPAPAPAPRRVVAGSLRRPARRRSIGGFQSPLVEDFV
jgi:MFS family permease